MDARMTHYSMLSEALAGAVAKYHTDIKWQLQHSEKKNKYAKDKYIKQMSLLIYYLEPKLRSNAVQIILVNTHVQLNIQLSQGSAATNLRGGGKFYSSFTCGSYRNTTWKDY